MWVSTTVATVAVHAGWTHADTQYAMGERIAYFTRGTECVKSVTEHTSDTHGDYLIEVKHWDGDNESMFVKRSTDPDGNELLGLLAAWMFQPHN